LKDKSFLNIQKHESLILLLDQQKRFATKKR